MGCSVADTFRDELVVLLPRLRAYAVGLLGRTAEADDLVQDTFVRAMRYRQGYTPGSNLRAWLFTILRNEFLNQARSGRSTVQDVDGKFAGELVSEAQQEWCLAYAELLAAIELLSPATREALLLVTAAGCTYEEAAASCGCAVGTVKSRVNRARAQLAEILDGGVGSKSLYVARRRAARPAAVSAVAASRYVSAARDLEPERRAQHNP